MNAEFRLGGYNLLLRLLTWQQTQEADILCYGNSDPAFPGYYFKTEKVFHVPPLHAKKRSGIVCHINVDNSGLDLRCLLETQLDGILSRESE